MLAGSWSRQRSPAVGRLLDPSHRRNKACGVTWSAHDPHHITSHHITSHHITSHHITSPHIHVRFAREVINTSWGVLFFIPTFVQAALIPKLPCPCDRFINALHSFFAYFNRKFHLVCVSCFCRVIWWHSAFRKLRLVAQLVKGGILALERASV